MMNQETVNNEMVEDMIRALLHYNKIKECYEMVKNEMVKDMMKALLHYSFDEIQWDFNQLTEREKEIIGDQENFNKIKEYYEMTKNEMVEDMTRALLHYSFDQIQWDFNQLTEREKEIIEDQENFNKIKEYYDISSN